MLFENCNTGTKQGDVGEAYAILHYTKLGYTVSRTIFDSAKYDLIVDDGNQLKRVQVKTTSFKRINYNGYNASGYCVKLSTSGGSASQNTRRKPQKDDYDELFILTENEDCWIIPISEIVEKDQIVIGADGSRAKYNEYKI